jgi:hypothetical protein
MSRSRKKHPILKDKTGHMWYNRIIRRRQRQQVKEILTLQDVMDYEISNPKTFVNDYDICDWVLNIGRLNRFWSKYFSTDDVEKALRK